MMLRDMLNTLRFHHACALVTISSAHILVHIEHTHLAPQARVVLNTNNACFMLSLYVSTEGWL
jgi:hypothetical protein